ncbi:ogr/Delta-like zinc finger family protein [Gallibacterium faecale]|uniref:ogr/Delta-like zinc finger family protein n=1 Tax=Gallibacterium faecale TaxID=3019086 RepID=UPI0039B7472E
MAKIFTIYCRHCGHKAYITRSVREHADLTKLYCTCTNQDCNHKFVQNVEYSHTVRSSDLVKNTLLLNLIDKLSRDEQQKIFDHIQQKNR